MITVEGGRRLYWKLAVGLLAATGVYVWYVSAQYERLRDLYQRQLANAVAELRVTYDNARVTVKRFEAELPQRVGPVDPFERFDADQPYLTLRDCHAPLHPFEIPTGSQAQAATGHGGCYVFQPDVVLRELSLPDALTLFVIADDQGAALQQIGLDRSWVRHLRWAEQTFRDAAADQVGIRSLRQVKTLFADDAEWHRASAMSSRTAHSIGGQRFELYLEPLVIEDAGSNERVSLVFIGGVASSTLFRQALAVDSYFLAGIVLLLLLGVLGFPFIKLVSLDPRERFRLRDVTLLYLSTAALLALFTFVTHGIDGYVRWSATADRGLASLADRITDDVIGEVHGLVEQLSAYDEVVAARRPTIETPLQTDWYSTTAGGNDRTPLLMTPTLPLQIEQASWLDPSGRQVWKATADATTGRSPDNLSGRIYFRAVRDGHLYQLDPSSPPFYMGPDRSMRDGKFYTFISLASRWRKPSEGRSGPPYTVMASTRLLSLSASTLPAGYGFAVVNREGRVLYHSDARQSLRENFFEALSDGARARSMVYAGNESHRLNSRYRERAHRLYFRPVPLFTSSGDRSGLHVVTFRDTSIERAVVARVFVIALLGPLLLLVAFIAVSLFVMALVPMGRRQRWSVWLWPHGGLIRLYQQLSALLASLLAGTIVWHAFGGSPIAYAVLPIVVVVVAIALYVWHTRQPPPRRGLSAPLWYAAVFCLLLVCAIVVPASALFRAALRHEFGKLIATEQAWIAAQRTDLPFRIGAEVRAEKGSEEMASRLAKAHGPYLTAEHVPEPFATTLVATDPSARWLLAPFHWVDALLPIENDYSARLWYEDHEWSYTPSGTWLRRLQLSMPGLVCLLATFALLIGWMRWKVTHLYFADREATLPADEPFEVLWNRCSEDERLVLLQTECEHVVNPGQRPLIEGLLARGLLTLGPDLRPFSKEFGAFIRAQAPKWQKQLEEWETVDSGHSWRYVRLVLVVSVAGLAFFLVATQPGLQSGLLGVATGVTGVLSTSLKLRDAVSAWVSRPKTPA